MQHHVTDGAAEVVEVVHDVARTIGDRERRAGLRTEPEDKSPHGPSTQPPSSKSPPRARAQVPRDVHKIRFAPGEWTTIVARATACGMTPARYVRETALGITPPPRRGHATAPLVRELGRIAIDLQRLRRDLASDQLQGSAGALRATVDEPLARTIGALLELVRRTE